MGKLLFGRCYFDFTQGRVLQTTVRLIQKTVSESLVNDRTEKQFIFRHSKIVFDLMDEDGGGTISADEFAVSSIIRWATSVLVKPTSVTGDQ